VRLLRIEPGNAHLARLRDESRLNDLADYIDDPRASRHLRRRATSFIASAKPGGGRAGWKGPTEPSMIPVLAPLLESDGDPSVRRSAAYGLRRTGDQAAVPALLRALSDPDNATRTHAIIGLGDLQARAAVEPVSELLDQRRDAGTAAQALVKIGDERALGPLKAAAASTKSRRRKEKLIDAVADLERRVGLLPAP
jgi:HEAT repeat protein